MIFEKILSAAVVAAMTLVAVGADVAAKTWVIKY
jgi:hypothetical protein